MRIKLRILLLVIGLSGSFSAFSQTYSGGSGTIGAPYQIANKADLKYLSENSAEWSKHFIQTANIAFLTADFQSVGDFYNSGNLFSPIGNNSISFNGSYEGDDFTIDNLQISRAAQYYVGFFGYTNGASISNIGLTNTSITGHYYTGSLVGVNNTSTISNSYSTGTVSGQNRYVGGLVGNNSNTSTITNSYSTVTVSGQNRYVGGLVGDNSGTSTISNSYSTGAVSGQNYHVGGLVGNNSSTSTISNSYSSGTVNGQGYYVGGLAGSNETNSIITTSHSTGSVTGAGNTVGGLIGFNYSGTVSNSYSTGDVVGVSNCGGLVGNNFTGGTVSNSYSTGNVTGSGSSIGGLAGNNQNSTITNSYSTGAASGNGPGGLVGADISGTVNNSFWDTETSGLATSAGGVGKTTAEMQTLSTFTSATWDFTGETTNGTVDIWQMCVVVDYPIFASQNCTVSSIVNEKNNEESFFSIYPNPVKENFTVEFKKSFSSTFVITDQVGRIVKEGTIASQKQVINLSDLSKGIYVITIENVNQKLIKD